MTALQQIDTAVRALAEAGCRRDPASGYWITKDELALDGDPVEAIRELRREAVASAVRNHQSEGRCFTR